MFEWEAYVVSLMMRKGLEAAADAGREVMLREEIQAKER